jgi:hypothetical protein
MLARLAGLVGAAIVLVAACGGSSTDSPTHEPGAGAGKGGQGGSGGSGANGGSSGEAAAATGASAGKGGSTATVGKGGSSGAAGKGGSSGSVAKGGSSGSATKGGSSGKSGSPPEGGMAGDATGEAGAATGGVSIDDAPATVAVELCDKIYDCCSAAELMNIQGIGSSKTQCELAVAVFITLQVNAVKPAIAAGRVGYDGGALSRCLDDYGSRSCDMLRSIETFQCDGLIVPKQAVGDACGVNAECIDGYCDGANDANSPAGKCAATKANDADCAANAECQTSFCNGDGKCADSDASALCGG